VRISDCSRPRRPPGTARKHCGEKSRIPWLLRARLDLFVLLPWRKLQGESFEDSDAAKRNWKVMQISIDSESRRLRLDNPGRLNSDHRHRAARKHNNAHHDSRSLRWARRVRGI